MSTAVQRCSGSVMVHSRGGRERTDSQSRHGRLFTPGKAAVLGFQHSRWVATCHEPAALLLPLLRLLLSTILVSSRTCKEGRDQTASSGQLCHPPWRNFSTKTTSLPMRPQTTLQAEQLTFAPAPSASLQQEHAPAPAPSPPAACSPCCAPASCGSTAAPAAGAGQRFGVGEQRDGGSITSKCMAIVTQRCTPYLQRLHNGQRCSHSPTAAHSSSTHTVPTLCTHLLHAPQRLQRRRLAEVALVPVGAQPDALLRVCQRLARLAQLQQRRRPVAARRREGRGGLGTGSWARRDGCSGGE